MHMWEEMMPKTGKPKSLARITSYVLDILASEDVHALDMVPYPYSNMGQRGCPYIFFTPDELPNEKGNINAMFKLLQFHFILAILNEHETCYKYYTF